MTKVELLDVPVPHVCGKIHWMVLATSGLSRLFRVSRLGLRDKIHPNVVADTVRTGVWGSVYYNKG